MTSLETGFFKASSDNLPKIDAMMVADFFMNSECFAIGETRGAKMNEYVHCFEV